MKIWLAGQPYQLTPEQLKAMAEHCNEHAPKYHEEKALEFVDKNGIEPMTVIEQDEVTILPSQDTRLKAREEQKTKRTKKNEQ